MKCDYLLLVNRENLANFKKEFNKMSRYYKIFGHLSFPFHSITGRSLCVVVTEL